MRHFYLDASAWTKRFTNELGGETVSAFLEAMGAGRPVAFCTSGIAIAETVAAINRYHNRTRMPAAELAMLIDGVLNDLTRLTRLPVLDDDSLDAIPLIARFNLNASDAVQLQGIQSRLVRAASVKPRDITLVTSDQRFLCSAMLAGLHTLDPASFPAGDVPALFVL